MSDDLNAKLRAEAEKLVGRDALVSKFGIDCFALVDKLLRQLGAETAADGSVPVTSKADYDWGDGIMLTSIQPGDILQFSKHVVTVQKFTRTDSGWFETEARILTRPHHTGIVVAVHKDGSVTVVEQNVAPNPKKALEGRDAGTVMPFVIASRDTGDIVGCTRFWKIDRRNRKLEIGHTWLGKSVQRTGVNTEAKCLLLTYAFEVMAAVRVQFTTDELNERSREAILRLGAKQEGVVRHERIMPDGRKRNSVRFSIIDDEWPDVKARLRARLERSSL